jgi:hypothetical protein
MSIDSYIVTTNCLSAEASASAEINYQANEVGNDYLLKSDKRFSKNGVVNKFGESGKLNEVEYDVGFLSGTGYFAGTKEGFADKLYDLKWLVQCKLDPITDKKTCSLSKYDFWIFVYDDGREIVSIGNEHFPGSSVILRIDKGKPFSTLSKNDGNFYGTVSKRIIKQLLDDNSEMFTTRYMKWPYREWVDERIGLYGFNEAYSYIKWAIKRFQ